MQWKFSKIYSFQIKNSKIRISSITMKVDVEYEMQTHLEFVL